MATTTIEYGKNVRMISTLPLPKIAMPERASIPSLHFMRRVDDVYYDIADQFYTRAAVYSSLCPIERLHL